MTIATLKLDTPSTLTFDVAITGASGIPEARFIIEDKEFSISYPCFQTNEGVEVEIKGLKNILRAGDYQARLEIVLENKLYVPLRDVITFEPTVEIAASKPIKQLKESIVMGKVTVKVTESIPAPINETFLRKTQAAMIIAKSLKYTPQQNESAQDTIDLAIKNSGPMSPIQVKTLGDMLKLAESVGVNINNIILPELLEEKTEEDTDELELDDMVDGVTDWEHIIHAYDDDELVIIDSETGEVLDHDLTEGLDENDELNEVLSRAERIKSKIRFARTANKRKRATRLALKRHSSNATINTRARRLAVNMMKTKLARGKPLADLSVPEKMRIEKIIENRSKLVGRLALKLTSRIRNIEKTRLAHKAVTQ